jgi:hypothetical protein
LQGTFSYVGSAYLPVRVIAVWTVRGVPGIARPKSES